MADILIKGLALPKHGNALVQLSSNGDVWVSNRDDEGTGIIIAKAVALPEHGRLIVADELLEKLERIVTPDDLTYTIARGILTQIVEDAETIVEATE